MAVITQPGGGLFEGFDPSVTESIIGSVSDPVPFEPSQSMGYDPIFGTPGESGWTMPSPSAQTGGAPSSGTPFDFSQWFGGGGSGGGGGSSSWLSQILDMFPGVSSGDPSQAMLLPALIAAMNQWKDSDRYMDYGREAAGMASPVSNDERLKSLQRYRSIEDDPNGYLTNSPLYQAALRQGLNTVERSQAAKGNLGSGEMLMALQEVGQDTAAKYVDKDLQRIREDAGFQFNPAHAASLYMQGVQGSIDSRNSALGSMMFPFMMRAQQNASGGGQPITINNQVGGPQQGRPTGSPTGGGGSIVDAISRMPLSSLPPQLWSVLGQIPGGIQGLFSGDPAVQMELERYGFGVDPNTGELSYTGTGSGSTGSFGDPYGIEPYPSSGPVPGFGFGSEPPPMPGLEGEELAPISLPEIDELEDWWAELFPEP